MSEPAVYWHEGMFLRPQHFQAAERHGHDQARQSARWDVHYNWGLRSIEIDRVALQNYRFVVRRLQARLRDGTLIRVPEDSGDLAHVDLKKALEKPGPVVVSLAVPTVQLGRANVGSGDAEKARYQVHTPPDGVSDENTGQSARPMQYRRLNLSLRLSGEDPAGFEVLPIATIERSAQAEALPQLSPYYIPPVLACDAWPLLSEDILQQTYHRIGKLVKQRAHQVQTRRITFDSQSPGDRRIFEGLRVLNEASAHLGIMAHAKGVHPLPAYLELCRLVGQLAIFDLASDTLNLPTYDHDDLGRCFFAAVNRINDLLNKDFESGYIDRDFVGSGLRMKVAMESNWLTPAWQMFVGVDSPLPTAECVQLLTGRLNMKIGSLDRVDEIFQRGLKGLAFAHNPRPPRVLPEKRTLTYFQVNRESSLDEWKHVENTLVLAIRLNDKLVAGNIEGQKAVAIRTEGSTTTMEFTLYVIPQPKPAA